VAVTSVHHEMTAFAAHACLEACAFAELVVLTDRPIEAPWRRIEALQGMADYNRFILTRLIDHVRTDFVLIFQWDGFVLDPAAWTDEFLEYDYVGAPWEAATAPPGKLVGNGGFSLRSRRLLEALRDPTLAFNPERPEDKLICRELRPVLEARHGLRFAPVELARRFSIEHGVRREPTFGFHGDFNFPAVLTDEALSSVLELLPEGFWNRRRLQRWNKQARDAGRPGAAKSIRRHIMARYGYGDDGWPLIPA